MDEQKISFDGVAQPMVEAAPRLSDVPAPIRGFRSGPVAATLATAVIVAATALPSAASFEPASLVPAAVTAGYSIDVVPSLEDLGSLKLEGSFESFTLQESGSSWDDRSDSSSILHVRFASSDAPDTFLFGDLVLRGRIQSEAMEVAKWELFAGTAPVVAGLDSWLRTDKPAPKVDIYTSLAGTLMGAGELEGASISVRNIPGTSVRRGPWASGHGDAAVSLSDTIFARIIWLRDTDSSTRGIQSEGGGSLSLYLSPDSAPE